MAAVAYWLSRTSGMPGRAIKVGDVLTFKGRLELYRTGLAFSDKPLDAISLGTGHLLWKVNVPDRGDHDERIDGPDQGCSSWRRHVTVIDATPVLKEFMRWSAQQVLPLWDAPKVVRDYLTTGKDALQKASGRAASIVAWESGTSVSAAANAAALVSCSKDNFAGAARSVAESVVSAKAWAATGDATFDVEVAKSTMAEQHKQFKMMVDDAFANQSSFFGGST